MPEPISAFWDWLTAQPAEILLFFTSSQVVTHWLYLGSALLLAVGVFALNRRVREESGTGLLGFLLPRRIYAHPSSIVDYKLYVANRLLSPLTAFASRIVVVSAIAAQIHLALGRSLGPPGWELGALGPLVFTIVSALVADLGNYLVHYLHHFVPVLWPIHRVHHSAEVLNPLTVHRKHPLYDAFKAIFNASLLGIVQGVVAFMFLDRLVIHTIIGVNSIYFFYHLLGGNLRHSHVWLSFGPFFDRIFLSPAHHQIHHSARSEHYGKNLGGFLALWDQMFGTFVLPTEEIRRNLVLGAGMGEPQRHPTLWRAYVEPLQAIGRVLRRGDEAAPR